MMNPIDETNHANAENMSVTAAIYGQLPAMMKEGIQTDYTQTTKVWWDETADVINWDTSGINMKAKD